jgi:hypothetical protein
MPASLAYLWLLTLLGAIGTAASLYVVLWRGPRGISATQTPARRTTIAFILCWTAWLVVSAGLAEHDAFRFVPNPHLPWLPVALLGALTAVLLTFRVPAVSRVFDRPDGVWRLTVQQRFRMVGIVLLIAFALGQLPASAHVSAGAYSLSRSVVGDRRERARRTIAAPRG